MFGVFFFFFTLKGGIDMTNKEILTAYNKEVNRIKRQIKYINKRGYTLDRKVIRNLKYPNINALNRLRKITLKDLYNWSKYEPYKDSRTSVPETTKQNNIANDINDPDTITQDNIENDVIYEADAIIHNFYDIINSFTPLPNWSKYWISKKKSDMNIVIKYLEKTIEEDGKVEVAKRLRDNKHVGTLLETIFYYSDEQIINISMLELTEIMKGDYLTNEENEMLTEYQFSWEWEL